MPGEGWRASAVTVENPVKIASVTLANPVQRRELTPVRTDLDASTTCRGHRTHQNLAQLAPRSGHLQGCARSRPPSRERSLSSAQESTTAAATMTRFQDLGRIDSCRHPPGRIQVEIGPWHNPLAVNACADVVSRGRVAAVSSGAMPRCAGPPTDPRPSTRRVRARGRWLSDRRSQRDRAEAL